MCGTSSKLGDVVARRHGRRRSRSAPAGQRSGAGRCRGRVAGSGGRRRRRTAAGDMRTALQGIVAASSTCRTSASGTSSNSATSPSRRGSTKRSRPATAFLSLRIVRQERIRRPAQRQRSAGRRRSSSRRCRVVTLGGDQAAPLGQPAGADHAGRDRLAVQPGAVAADRLEGVGEGVAVVQDRAQAGLLALVLLDHVGLQPATAARRCAARRRARGAGSRSALSSS